MLQLSRCMKSQSGSILVAVVVFSLLVTIAASALFTLSANGVSRDEDEIESDRAFRAAQAGLETGLHWIADTANWRKTYPTRHLVLSGDTINGFVVNVSVVDSGAGSRFVISEAQNSRYGFIRELSCAVSIDSMPCVLINNLPPQTTPLGPLWFDGPFHANTPILLSRDAFLGSNLLFFTNGPVSVRSTPEQGWGYGDAPSGNNYDFGITVVGATASGQDLDKHFDNTFLHSQDSVYLPQVSVTPTLVLESNGSYTTPGRLLFYMEDGLCKIKYYYRDSNYILRIQEAVLRAEEIIFSPSEIEVMGTYKGRITVFTPVNVNIYPIGDLIYDGFDQLNAQTLQDCINYDNSRNYGIPMTQQDFMALLSGGNIRFQKQYQYYYSGGSFKERTEWVPNLFLIAALIATNPGHKVCFNTVNVTTFKFNLRAVGCRVMDSLFDYTATAGGTANEQFRFFFDSRLLRGMGAPGVPPFQKRCRGGAGNDLFLLRTVMQERDIPLH